MESKMRMMKRIFLCVMFAFLTGCGPKGEETSSSEWGTGSDAGAGKPDVLLESVQIGAHSLEFYVDFGVDSAVMGFSVENDSDPPWFFPMYGSTYRGMPSVTLEVFVSKTQEEMWVCSSWPGYEVLAYYRLGTDWCITGYGETAYSDTPIPDSIGGTAKQFPEMNSGAVTRVATITYDDRCLEM